jgi:peptide/nickel transport system permease protein
MDLGSVLKLLKRREIAAVPSTAEGAKASAGGKEGTKKGGIRFYLGFMAKDRPAFVSLIVIVAFLGWALIEGTAQEIASLLGRSAYGIALLPSDPLILDFTNKLIPPSLSKFPTYILGTNYQGQSLLSRVLYAAPHDAMASIIIVGSAVLIGIVLGTASGYFGGWLDEVIMRITDAFLSLPALVLAIAVSAILGSSGASGFYVVLAALVIVWWPTYARFFRAQALAIRNRAYVESAKLSGSGSLRILLRHIFPNSIDPIVAYATLDLGTVILTYSALAFLGIGVDPRYPEWGADSSFGLTYFPGDWWWAILPGVVITIIVVAFTLVGDRLDDLVTGRMTY